MTSFRCVPSAGRFRHPRDRAGLDMDYQGRPSADAPIDGHGEYVTRCTRSAWIVECIANSATAGVGTELVLLG
jgi:hypothetical protein